MSNAQQGSLVCPEGLFKACPDSHVCVLLLATSPSLLMKHLALCFCFMETCMRKLVLAWPLVIQARGMPSTEAWLCAFPTHRPSRRGITWTLRGRRRVACCATCASCLMSRMWWTMCMASSMTRCAYACISATGPSACVMNSECCWWRHDVCTVRPHAGA